jgi:hypothetical protein
MRLLTLAIICSAPVAWTLPAKPFEVEARVYLVPPAAVTDHQIDRGYSFSIFTRDGHLMGGIPAAEQAGRLQKAMATTSRPAATRGEGDVWLYQDPDPPAPDTPLELVAMSWTTEPGEGVHTFRVHDSLPLEYMVRHDDAYVLKTFDKPLGWDFSIDMVYADADGRVALDVNVIPRMVSRREKVEGLELEVGKPSLSDEGTYVQMARLTGHWQALALRPILESFRSRLLPPGSFLVLLLRVNRTDAPWTPPAPVAAQGVPDPDLPKVSLEFSLHHVDPALSDLDLPPLENPDSVEEMTKGVTTFDPSGISISRYEGITYLSAPRVITGPPGNTAHNERPRILTREPTSADLVMEQVLADMFARLGWPQDIMSTWLADAPPGELRCQPAVVSDQSGPEEGTWLDPQGDGSYIAKVLPIPWKGMQVGCLPALLPDGRVTLEFGMVINEWGTREPAPGTVLPVGRPIVRTTRLKARLNTPGDGGHAGFIIPAGTDGEDGISDGSRYLVIVTIGRIRSDAYMESASN